MLLTHALIIRKILILHTYKFLSILSPLFFVRLSVCPSVLLLPSTAVALHANLSCAYRCTAQPKGNTRVGLFSSVKLLAAKVL